MATISQVLDTVRARRSLASDNALAGLVGVTRASVSNWRTGRNMPDPVQCARLADLAGLPLAQVIGAAGEARAISREEKAVWKRLASAAALFLLVGTTPLPGHARDSASEAGSGSISCNSRVLPIMSARHRLARFLRALWSAGVRPHGHLLAL